MKTAEEYIKDFWGLIDEHGNDALGNKLSGYDIAMVIKQAQIDAYNQGVDEAVKLCAERARVDNESASWLTGVDVDKQSILDCAEILKKQLWKQMN